MTLATDIGVVLAAGGSGSRFGGNKLLEKLHDLPVFAHSLRTFLTLVPAEHLVLVVSTAERPAYELALSALPFSIRGLQMVNGGATRQESVLAGLTVLPPTLEFAAVHDAARPWLNADLAEACFASARQHGSGVAAHAVTDTIKVVDTSDIVVSTPPRETLRAVETPQAFRRTDLIAAYRKAIAAGNVVTDDASAMELTGFRPRLVVHRSCNAKITYRHDLPEPGGR